MKCGLDSGEQRIFAKRLEQQIDRASSPSLSPLDVARMRRNKNDWNSLVSIGQISLELQAVDPRHSYVKDQTARLLDKA